MKKALILLILLSISGCSTFSGGMPTPPFKFDDNFKKAITSSTTINGYYAVQQAERKKYRDEFILSRLLLINMEYIKYIKNLNTEETSIHAATDVLVLSLDIAATAFTPLVTKTALSAISAAIGGTRLAIDENFYYSKTVPLLISTMNAERKIVLVRIIEGMGQELDGYPFEQALSDLNEYYLAGTIQGAIYAIHKNSGTQEANAENKIQKYLFEKRMSNLDPATKARVEKLLQDVDKLAKHNSNAVIRLASNPPITQDWIDIAVDKSYSYNSADQIQTAINKVKMRINIHHGSDYLNAWEAVINTELGNINQ